MSIKNLLLSDFQPLTDATLTSAITLRGTSWKSGLRFFATALLCALIAAGCSTTSHQATAPAAGSSSVPAAAASASGPTVTATNPAPPLTITPPTSTPTGSDLQSTLGLSYRLQEGDAISIKFDATTNLNTVVKLQLDGAITLPMIGEVKVMGKTTTELRAELMKQYEKLLKGEDITVSIISVTSCVYLSGAVLRPGRVSMDRPLTLMQGIMEAGGFDHNRAKISGVTIFRIENGKQQIFKVDMRKVMSGKITDVFYLKPFDTIHVPERTFNL